MSQPALTAEATMIPVSKTERFEDNNVKTLADLIRQKLAEVAPKARAVAPSSPWLRAFEKKKVGVHPIFHVFD